MTEPTNTPTFDLSTTKGVQSALTYLSNVMRHPEFDPKGTDGIDGPDTRSAVENFQSYADLTIDGVVGEETKASIARTVDIVTPSTLSTEPSPPPFDPFDVRNT